MLLKITLIIIVLLFGTNQAEASSVKINIEQNLNNNSTSTVKSDTQIDISTKGDSDTKVEISNNYFKISGLITALDTNSFEVSQQKIQNISSKFNDYNITGSLAIGRKVVVEGVTEGGSLFAKKIIVEGSTPQVLSESTSSPQQTESTPTAIPATDQTAQATDQPNSLPDFKLNGVILFIQNLLLSIIT